jgi:hypothetical protein
MRDEFILDERQEIPISRLSLCRIYFVSVRVTSRIIFAVSGQSTIHEITRTDTNHNDKWKMANEKWKMIRLRSIFPEV